MEYQICVQFCPRDPSEPLLTKIFNVANDKLHTFLMSFIKNVREVELNHCNLHVKFNKNISKFFEKHNLKWLYDEKAPDNQWYENVKKDNDTIINFLKHKNEEFLINFIRKYCNKLGCDEEENDMLIVSIVEINKILYNSIDVCQYDDEEITSELA